MAVDRSSNRAGCRRNEIIQLTWQEVDFEHGCLRLDDSKTGRSVRPLALAALTVLKSVRREPDSRYVFPSETGNSFFQGTHPIWEKAVAKAELPGVTPHTLRHTIGSASVSTGETLAMTGALLGHVTPQATSIYAHMQQDPARRAAERVVSPIALALGMHGGAEIIDLNSRRKWS